MLDNKKFFSYSGIKPVKLGLERADITYEKVVEVMPDIFALFKERREKTLFLRNQFVNQHEIKNKKRNNGKNLFNAIIIEPHLHFIVSYLTALLLGNPKAFQLAIDNEKARQKAEQKKDVRIFRKYEKDTDIGAIDVNVAEWINSTGGCYYFIDRRADDFDINAEAPFVISKKTYANALKVTSSIDDSELFDIVVVPKFNSKNNAKSLDDYDLWVWLYHEKFRLDKNFKLIAGSRVDIDEKYRRFPLVDKYSNEDRYSPVELGLNLQNAINQVSSDTVDNINDVVNQMLVILNCEITKETLEKAKKVGALELKGQGNLQADVKAVKTPLDVRSPQTIREWLVKVLYDACGVPAPSSASTSRGDTGAARLIGSGFEASYVRAKKDEQNFISADRRLLRKMLAIAKMTENSPLKKLYASDFDVRYHINRTENILSMAQAIRMLIDIGYPLEDVAELMGVSPEVAVRWIDNVTKAAKGRIAYPRRSDQWMNDPRYNPLYQNKTNGQEPNDNEGNYADDEY